MFDFIDFMDFMACIIMPIVLTLLIVLLFCLTVGMPLSFYFEAKIESELFNKMHKTDYSIFEFMFGGELIKDYTETGKINTVKLDIAG